VGDLSTLLLNACGWLVNPSQFPVVIITIPPTKLKKMSQVIYDATHKKETTPSDNVEFISFHFQYCTCVYVMYNFEKKKNKKKGKNVCRVIGSRSRAKDMQKDEWEGRGGHSDR
jgi:hypothetical protein